MTKEFRSSSWEAGENEEKISGYAVVFEQRTVLFKDSFSGIESGEIIDAHAFDNCDMTDVILRFNHTGRVLARTRNGSLKLSVDAHGLKIEADMSQSDEAKSLYRDVKNGLVDKMSFAFTVAENGDVWESDTHTRRIKAIDKLIDVSLVDFPAYDATEVQARAKESVEAEIRSFNKAAVVEYRKQADEILDELRINGMKPEDFDYPDEAYGISAFGDFTCRRDPDLKESDVIYKKMLEYRAKSFKEEDAEDALLHLRSIQSLENQLDYVLKEKYEKRQKILSEIAAGKGKLIHSFRKEENLTMESKNNTFYNELIEKRAAASVSGMNNIIPTEIADGHLREGKNGLYDHISFTNIEHGGNIKLPYVADSDFSVSEHTENSEITPDGKVPSAVEVTHEELQCTQGYSFLGARIAASQLEQIVSDGLFSAMRAKLDRRAIAAVNALTFVKDANAVAWTNAGAPKLAEILTLMKMLPERYASDAMLFMNRATSLSIIENSTGSASASASNNMYNVDVTSALTTLFGVPVCIDSNVADGEILYGCPKAIHLNVAGNVLFNNWLDHDSLTEKMQIACAAGAGAEVASFVKGANSIG